LDDGRTPWNRGEGPSDSALWKGNRRGFKRWKSWRWWQPEYGEHCQARAREFLVLIASLYGIEKEAREGAYTPEARKALRQEKAPALLDRLHRKRHPEHHYRGVR